MAGALPAREQALPLLAAANNHGDLAVKLSSLKQAKDILLSAQPSHAAELFPFLVELHSSPEILVRKCLLELIDEIGAKSIEHLSLLLPILLTFLKDHNPTVVKQCIVTGTKFFSSVLEELAFQFQRRGIVERWLEELWTWMIKFRDAVFEVIFEAGPVGPKLLGIKFLESYVLQFTLDSSDSGTYIPAVNARSRRSFNISLISGSHPVLDAPSLTSDANRFVAILLDMMRSANNLPGLLTISAINCLAVISRKRPFYYNPVLAALLDFNPNFEMTKSRHTVSIQYCLRTAFLGFLRCTHPVIAESRELLLKALRAMNAGDAADQVIRQMDKINKNNERAPRDLQPSQDDLLLHQSHISGDVTKKRSAPLEDEDQNNSFDVVSKRFRYASHNNPTATVDTNNTEDHANRISYMLPGLDGDLTPVEQMIAMIGALIAEGERGVKPLEILISNIHPDLLADIVITNMKHLPKNLPPPARNNNLLLNCPNDSSTDPELVVASNTSATCIQTFGLAAQLPASSSNTTSLPFSDMYSSPNLPTDSKRDPRRDPRRLDPRHTLVSADVPLPSVVEDYVNSVHGSVQSNLDVSASHTTQVLPPPGLISETISVSFMPKLETDLNVSESPLKTEAEQPTPRGELEDVEAKEFIPDRVKDNGSHHSSPPPPVRKYEEAVTLEPMDAVMLDETYSPSSQEIDSLLPDTLHVESNEVTSTDLPLPPSYIVLSEDHQRNMWKEALQRVIDSHKNLHRTYFKQAQMGLVARLLAQIDVDDLVGMVQKRIVADYEQQKGHEFVMHILYHLHSLVISDSTSPASAVYEKFLLRVAKFLLDDLPASDKSFSRLLGEVPCIPESILRLLSDICTENHSQTDGRDSDRVTQGLGAVWSLIMGRPVNRQACLDIALKCAVHSKDDVRAKAIRLVANKLYVIGYLSETIEQFATSMFLSAVDQHDLDTVTSESVVSERRIEEQVVKQETSAGESQVSGSSQNDSKKGAEAGLLSDSSISFSQAQCFISLYFALCTKKPNLLQLVFDKYARALKPVKQAVHRHIPVLIRTLRSSDSDSPDSELFRIISDPPQGSEQLLTQVLHVLSEDPKRPPGLAVTVKRLYETRLKDATVLIPVLSAFSKDEVLPIFPQLVQLPLDKFRTALAHILQGSAHTGPALTPVEVLVAIHDISPERDGVPLKKITDACSACFEQRTVFTHQVLANSLNQMVDRNPLPLLFMRTVIQAIYSFPTLGDFVMEILCKLVRRQVWRMPKLWVGFLKCISQTQPRSFQVLVQLPAPQLESFLNKYAHLRGPFTAFVNQSSYKSSIPRSTLEVLGLSSEAHTQELHATSSLPASDPSPFPD